MVFAQACMLGWCAVRSPIDRTMLRSPPLTHGHGRQERGLMLPCRGNRGLTGKDEGIRLTLSRRRRPR